MDKLIDDKNQVWVPYDEYMELRNINTNLQIKLDALNAQIPMTYGEAKCDC